MESSSKATMHKSCSCKSCRRGRNHLARNLNERKLRRMSKRELLRFILGEKEDAEIHPISSPYTD